MQLYLNVARWFVYAYHLRSSTSLRRHSVGDRQINACEVLVWWYWQGKTEVLRENTFIVPLYTSHIPHGLIWDRSRASAVRIIKFLKDGTYFMKNHVHDLSVPKCMSKILYDFTYIYLLSTTRFQQNAVFATTAFASINYLRFLAARQDTVQTTKFCCFTISLSLLLYLPGAAVSQFISPAGYLTFRLSVTVSHPYGWQS